MLPGMAIVPLARVTKAPVEWAGDGQQPGIGEVEGAGADAKAGQRGDAVAGGQEHVAVGLIQAGQRAGGDRAGLGNPAGAEQGQNIGVGQEARNFDAAGAEGGVGRENAAGQDQRTGVGQRKRVERADGEIADGADGVLIAGEEDVADGAAR